MTAPIHIDTAHGLVWTEDDRGFTVTIDGKDTRYITRDGSGFIAWLGCQDRHWCFAKALEACAEHARFHRAEHERQVSQYEANHKRLASLSQQQRTDAIASLQERRARLEYADSHMDVMERGAELDRQIGALVETRQTKKETA